MFPITLFPEISLGRSASSWRHALSPFSQLMQGGAGRGRFDNSVLCHSLRQPALLNEKQELGAGIGVQADGPGERSKVDRWMVEGVGNLPKEAGKLCY